MPTTKLQIQYILIPHPDDEFSAWSMIQRAAHNYPVFICLTQGEGSGFCSGAGLQTNLGERTPQPQPFTGKNTTNCRLQRLDSFHTFLNSMADIDAELDYPIYAGKFDSNTFDLWVGNKSARVVFDLGDGKLTPQKVTDALQRVRSLRHTYFPLQKEYGVIGAAYNNKDANGSLVYDHVDHRSIHEALWHTDQGLPGPQWCRTSRFDSDVSRVSHVAPDIYDHVMAVNADGYRRGTLQKIYGWLGQEPDGSWARGEQDTYALFSREQAFWSRF